MLSKSFTRWIVLVWIPAWALVASPIAAQTTIPSLRELGEPGPYVVGSRSLTLTDTSRDGRVMNDLIWYPASPPENATKAQQALARLNGWKDATPNPQTAPYPLVLISPGWTQPVTDMTPVAVSLASHGYIVVGLDHPEEKSPLSFVNRPLDVLFTIDQLASNSPDDFDGIIDTNHIGIMGESYGAYTTLALTGARLNPALATTITAKPVADTNFNDLDPRHVFPDWDWNVLTTFHNKFVPSSGDDELWPPFSDQRIMAAVMFSPCWISMFGEQGLAAATVPSLIIGGTKDDICLYDEDDTYAFAHLGSKDHFLVTLVDGGHVPAFNDLYRPVTAQLYRALFDEYLKGQQDAAHYMTKEWVDTAASELKINLVWGPYTGQ